MLSDTLQIIKGLFEHEIDNLRPVKIHLEHQLSLAEKDRILKQPEEDLSHDLMTMRSELKTLQIAYDDFLNSIPNDNS